MKIKNALVVDSLAAARMIKAVSLAVCIISFTPAFANVIYTYTSERLSLDGTSPPLIAATGPSIDPFSIILNFSDSGSLINWSASQSLIGSFSSSDPFPAENAYRPIVYLDTSPSGVPTTWFFTALTQHSGSPYWRTMIISMNGINWAGQPLLGYFYDNAAWDSPPPDVHAVVFGYGRSPGVWTSEGSLSNLTFRYDPNFDSLYPTAIPEPATQALLGLGLAALLLMRRKNIA